MESQHFNATIRVPKSYYQNGKRIRWPKGPEKRARKKKAPLERRSYRPKAGLSRGLHRAESTKQPYIIVRDKYGCERRVHNPHGPWVPEVYQGVVIGRKLANQGLPAHTYKL